MLATVGDDLVEIAGLAGVLVEPVAIVLGGRINHRRHGLTRKIRIA